MLARRGVIETLLVALCVACYWGSLRGPWLLDDHVLIARNPMVQRAEWWPRIWVSDYWESIGVQTGLYRPLPVATYALTYALAGANTLPYHATNLALHILATLLVFRVLLRGARNPQGARNPRDALALGAAALFAVHPVHAEAVANVVGRSELLVAVGFLVALWAHRALAAGEHASRRRRAAWIAAELAGAAVMLFSKETGVALLLYFLVEDAGTGRLADRAVRRRLAPAYLALTAVAAAYALLRSFAVTGAMIGPQIDSVRGRLALTATAALKNAQMLLLPAGQRAVWNHPPLDAVPWWAIAAGIALVAALGLATAAAARRATPLRLALALAFISSLLLLHPVPNTAWIWERGLYVPSIGIVWALYAMGDSVALPRGRSLAAALLCIAAALFAPRAWRMSRVFSGESEFWSHQAAMDPADTAALVSLSEVRLRGGDREGAAALRARAYGLEPARAPVVAAHAALLLEMGDPARARDVLTSAARTRLEFHNTQQAVLLLRSLEQLARRAAAPEAAQVFAGQASRRARRAVPARE